MVSIAIRLYIDLKAMEAKLASCSNDLKSIFINPSDLFNLNAVGIMAFKAKRFEFNFIANQLRLFKKAVSRWFENSDLRYSDFTQIASVSVFEYLKKLRYEAKIKRLAELLVKQSQCGNKQEIRKTKAAINKVRLAMPFEYSNK